MRRAWRARLTVTPWLSAYLGAPRKGYPGVTLPRIFFHGPGRASSSRPQQDGAVDSQLQRVTDSRRFGDRQRPGSCKQPETGYSQPSYHPDPLLSGVRFQVDKPLVLTRILDHGRDLADGRLFACKPRVRVTSCLV
jgi:hypothetical protein